jgi:multicomponent Na+:H+ antiporter subunit D
MQPVLLVIIPLISAYVIFLVGYFLQRVSYYLTVLSISVTFIISLFYLRVVHQNGSITYCLGGWPPPWGIEYLLTPLNIFVASLVLFIALLIILYCGKSIYREINDRFSGKLSSSTFYTIFLLLTAGLTGISITNDLFNLYVFLEITSLCAYGLIASGEDKSLRASFNYMVYGTIGASFYLLGVGYLYIMTGTLNLTDLAKLIPAIYQSKVVLVALIFFTTGLILKIGLFPLHIWLPDAYTYAPSSVSAFISALVSKVMILTFYKVLFSAWTTSSSEMTALLPFLSYLSSAAILYGSIMAIAQDDIKRVLAYSSIAQVGYIVLGISLANEYALKGAFLHIFYHAMMKGLLFLSIGAVIYQTGIRRVQDIKGLAKRMPLTFAIFTISALSIIGIPPFAGFFSKWYLLIGAVETNNWFFVIVLILGSLLSVIYFFRILEKAYLIPPGPDNTTTSRPGLPASMFIPMAILCLGLCVCGFFSKNIIDYAIRF